VGQGSVDGSCHELVHGLGPSSVHGLSPGSVHGLCHGSSRGLGHGPVHECMCRVKVLVMVLVMN